MTLYGFTRHEGDDDLGLNNMKGRIHDPTLGHRKYCLSRRQRGAADAQGLRALEAHC